YGWLGGSTAIAPSGARPTQIEQPFSASHADVAEPALFLNHSRRFDGAAMREQPLLQTGKEDYRKLETLGIMDRQHRDLRLLIYLVGVAYQSGVIQKRGDILPALCRLGRGIDQFVNVANAAFGILALVHFEHAEVAGFFNDLIQQLAYG